MLLPRFISKLLAVFRGSVAPPLIFISVLLGFWMGLMPGWSGLHTALAVIILVFNVHIGLFILSLGFGKALSLAAAPLLYHAGIWVHGHMAWLLTSLSSVPVIGMTDFSRFALAGALVLGPIAGAVLGLVLAVAVFYFRRMMVKVNEKSDKFRKYYSNIWVTILDMVIIGWRTRKIDGMFAKTKYIRKAGAILAILLVAGFMVAMHFVQNSAVKDYATKTLTQANKAEANLGELGISVLGGNVQVANVQLTDPKNPQQNHLAIEKMQADANIYELLLGRLVLEKVELSQVRFNQARETPGAVPEQPAGEEPNDPNAAGTGTGTETGSETLTKLEKYVKDAKKLKEQLEKLRNWLPEKKPGVEAEQPPHKYLDYLDARAQTPPTPKMLAKLLLADKTEIPSALFGNSRVEMKNLSEAPAAARLPISMEIKSYVTSALLKAVMDYSKGDTPEVSGTFEGFDLSKLQADASQDTGMVIQSGLAGGTFNGTLTKEQVDLTINVGIKDLKAQGSGKGILGFGAEETSQIMQVLKEINTTIRVVGPVTQPRLVFDVKGLTNEFKNALVNAGKERALQEVDKQIEKQLGGKLGDKLPPQIKDNLKGGTKGLLDNVGGLLGGKKKQEEKK